MLRKLQALGIETLINDPPLAATKTSDHRFVDLDTILSECNFITLHVPLTKDGDYPTCHLFDLARLQQLTKECVLVNAARGPVIDNAALLEILDHRPDLTLFLDTWENEPQVSRELLQKVDLATPHIAGYGVEGRLRGTQMILDAAAQYFGLDSNWRMESLLPEPIELNIEPSSSDLAFWQQLFASHHDIWQDHDALTQSAQMSNEEFASHFDSLRRIYPDRFEYERYRVNVISDKKVAYQIERLLFNVER